MNYFKTFLHVPTNLWFSKSDKRYYYLLLRLRIMSLLCLLPYLVQAQAKLYGVTSNNVRDAGTVFHYTPATQSYVLDFSFENVHEGLYPNEYLTEAPNGKFYGTTLFGGSCGNEGGIMFEWDPDSNIYRVLTNFCNTNIQNPSGPLTYMNGALYGVSYAGGPAGCGTHFKKVINGQLSSYGIWDCYYGNNPTGVLAIDGNKLYGINSDAGDIDPIAECSIFEWNVTTNNISDKTFITDVPHFAGGLVPYNGLFYGMTNNNIYEWNPNTYIFTPKSSFNSSQGYGPLGSLSLYGNKFYGMTSQGAANNFGAIFEWDPATNIYTPKINFNNLTGIPSCCAPNSLTLNAGKFYGMTNKGGLFNKGVIFEWDPTTNIYTKKIDFDGVIGAAPQGTLKFKNGKFYGMTSKGGDSNNGTIFEWDANTNICIKRIDFTAAKATTPLGSLTLNTSNGKIYGMTSKGGRFNMGTIFECDSATGKCVVKYEFDDIFGNGSGKEPAGSLTFFDGKLYGMTTKGGANAVGTIFEWDFGADTLIKMMDFDGTAGTYPYGALVENNGRLYGMTSTGGINSKGTIFEWEPNSNNYTTKIDFDGTNGATPYGNIAFSGGKGYGLTQYGGYQNRGVLFEWDIANNTCTSKLDFNATNGKHPTGSLVLYNNKFYGLATMGGGGTNNNGVLFEWNPATNVCLKKHVFDGVNGGFPMGSLTLSNGKFYGLTNKGGANDYGVLFEWSPTANTYTKLIDFDGINGKFPVYTQLLEVNGNSNVGIVEEITTHFSLSPNPTTDKLLITLNTYSQETIQLTLTDILGKRLSQWQDKSENRMYQKEISLENLSPGLYLLSIEIGKRVITQKFVKN